MSVVSLHLSIRLVSERVGVAWGPEESEVSWAALWGEFQKESQKMHEANPCLQLSISIAESYSARKHLLTDGASSCIPETERNESRLLTCEFSLCKRKLVMCPRTQQNKPLHLSSEQRPQGKSAQGSLRELSPVRQPRSLGPHGAEIANLRAITFFSEVKSGDADLSTCCR